MPHAPVHVTKRRWEKPPEPIEINHKISYRLIRVPGVIFNLAEIIPRGQGFWYKSDLQAELALLMKQQYSDC